MMNVIDAARAAIAMVWSRSWPRQEMERLVEDGWVAGNRCDVAFSVELEEAGFLTLAAEDAREAGFRVDSTDRAKRFLTVVTTMPLTPRALSLAASRIERIAHRHGGWAALVGPVAQAATTGEVRIRTPRPTPRAAAI